MPFSMLPSFVLYAVVITITPGPANLCSLSAALRYGPRAALVQVRGMVTGFAVVSLTAVVLALALGTVLEEYVALMSWVGAGYILYLAWKTLRDDGDLEGGGGAPSFQAGLLLQLTNPKSLMACVTTLTAYVLPWSREVWDLLAVGLVMPLFSVSSNLVWLLAGAALRRFVLAHRRAVNRVMAAALALCAVRLVLG